MINVADFLVNVMLKLYQVFLNNIIQPGDIFLTCSQLIYYDCQPEISFHDAASWTQVVQLPHVLQL